jgi:hypothetical protein
MTEEERAMIGRWFVAGAKLDERAGHCRGRQEGSKRQSPELLGLWLTLLV